MAVSSLVNKGSHRVPLCRARIGEAIRGGMSELGRPRRRRGRCRGPVLGDWAEPGLVFVFFCRTALLLLVCPAEIGASEAPSRMDMEALLSAECKAKSGVVSARCIAAAGCLG